MHTHCPRNCPALPFPSTSGGHAETAGYLAPAMDSIDIRATDDGVNSLGLSTLSLSISLSLPLPRTPPLPERPAVTPRRCVSRFGMVCAILHWLDLRPSYRRGLPSTVLAFLLFFLPPFLLPLFF